MTVAYEMYERIPLPPNCSRLGHSTEKCLAVVMDDVLTVEECSVLVKRGENAGLNYIREARHDVDGETFYIAIQNPREYRLAVFEDADFSAKLWERLKQRLAGPIDDFASRDGWGPALGLNERLRVLQYSGKESFPAHFDLVVADDDGVRQSLLTVLLYLNNGGGTDFCGGDTLFLDYHNVNTGSVGITPRAGRVVLFEHELYHTGSPLDPTVPRPESSTAEDYGSKFVMRTDVMFNIEKPLSKLLGDGDGADRESSTTNKEEASVTEMLDRLGLQHLKAQFSDFGFLTSLEGLKSAGETPVRMMLREMDITKAESEMVIKNVFS